MINPNTEQKYFDVVVTATKIEEFHYTILAEDEDDAADQAYEYAEHEGDFDDIEVSEIYYD